MATYKTKHEHADHFRHVARTEWFKDHKVIYTELAEGMTVVDFCKPGTHVYALRYIYSGHYVYVSGELGCAVFDCTWQTKPVDKVWGSLWYVFEKLRASEYGRDCMDFDSKVCMEKIHDMLLETDSDGVTRYEPGVWTQDERETYNELLHAAENWSSRDGWAMAIQEIEQNNSISDLDSDWWEWLYNAGDVMPASIVGIITGLQIVSEMLDATFHQPENAGKDRST